MSEPRGLVADVDVDDTLVRSFGSKRIPMTEMVRHVRDLQRDGVVLYAWSSGGDDYARDAARELGVEDCFAAFLPKPNIVIDDQAPGEWRRFVHVYPGGSHDEEQRGVHEGGLWGRWVGRDVRSTATTAVRRCRGRASERRAIAHA